MKILTFFAFMALPCALAGQESSVSKISNFNIAPFDLVISEIMADPEPFVGLPSAEFVEIYNRSSYAINLNGWILYEGASRVLPNVDLLPGELLLICANSDTSLFVPYGKVAGVSSLSLTNSGEKIALRNPQSIFIDSVTFSDSWYGSSYKKDGGWSLERVDNNFTCHLERNWKPSVNSAGGTPGNLNSATGVMYDNIAPLLLRAFCPDSVSIILVFSEPLDAITATNLLNFEIVNFPSPVNASVADINYTRILLRLNVPILKGEQGLVKIKNVTDCIGNKVVSGSFVKFGLPDTNTSGGIVFNEILFDPFEGGSDFVELIHTGNSLVDVKDLKLASFDLITGEIKEVKNISNEQWLIFPGEYLVISEEPALIASHYRTSYPYNFVEESGLPSMNIDAGHIALMKDNQMLDEFLYTIDYHFEFLESTKGISLEKINPLRNSMDQTSWHSTAPSAGFATPGLKNSQFVEASVPEKIVSVSPEIFSPDQDGKDDVVTFFIKSGMAGKISNLRIYNTGGHLIFENAANTLLANHDAFSWDGINDAGAISPPGIYIALVEIFDLEGEVKNYKLPFVLAIRL